MIVRRLLAAVLCLLFLSGCANIGYDAGYDNGYAHGYSAGLEDGQYASRSMPVPEEADPTPAKSKSFTDFTVYVSRSGMMHKKSTCSGMKYYTEMPYSVASEYYSDKCSKCFK